MSRIVRALGFTLFMVLFFVAPATALLRGTYSQPPFSISGVVVAVGDSLTLGLGASDGYVGFLQTAQGLITTIHYAAHSGGAWAFTDAGVPGTPNLTSRAAAEADIYVADSPQPYLLLWAGTNDISYGATGAATYASFETYIQARIAAGWSPSKIVVLDMISRTAISNAERVIYNDLLIAGTGTYGYKIARLDQNANIGCASCFSDGTYFTDGVHLTTVGQQLVATIVGALQ